MSSILPYSCAYVNIRAMGFVAVTLSMVLQGTYLAKKDVATPIKVRGRTPLPRVLFIHGTPWCQKSSKDACSSRLVTVARDRHPLDCDQALPFSRMTTVPDTHRYHRPCPWKAFG